ncbi:MAG TPA: SDR family NAD(P)-dependent oxidoreductase, partial [Longimicrobium sp.]|nr:SDR family NAD(P)-dependent oxidoreductase [Longimicrobium sp.]
RNADKARDTACVIAEAAPGARVDTVLADLSLQAEVRRAGAEILDRHPRIDVLVNNAAAFSHRRRETADGIELQLAVNHLAPFLLTSLLLERLIASAPARIVTVSSNAHHDAALRWDDLQMRHGYFGLRAYANSKLCNLLFTRELARRLAGTGVTANAMHPGVVGTALLFNGWSALRLGKPWMRTPEQGARTLVWLASSAEMEGVSGGYFKDEQPHPASPAAQDDAAALRLWRMSAALVGLPEGSPVR